MLQRDGPSSSGFFPDLRRGSHLYIFQNVPVDVCSKCGERYYPGRVLEHLDEIAEHGLENAKTVRVPTFDYRQVV